MALTVSNLSHFNFGSRTAVVADITGDSSYAASGESLTAADLGLGRVDVVIPDGSASGYTFKYDYNNAKLIAYFADYDAGADGALIDAGTEDLSSVTVRILAIGE